MIRKHDVFEGPASIFSRIATAQEGTEFVAMRVTEKSCGVAEVKALCIKANPFRTKQGFLETPRERLERRSNRTFSEGIWVNFLVDYNKRRVADVVYGARNVKSVQVKEQLKSIDPQMGLQL